jgi:hypothetical protein
MMLEPRLLGRTARLFWGGMSLLLVVGGVLVLLSR